MILPTNWAFTVSAIVRTRLGVTTLAGVVLAALVNVLESGSNESARFKGGTDVRELLPMAASMSSDPAKASASDGCPAPSSANAPS